MFTGKAVLPILFLIVGVIVATYQIRGKSEALVCTVRNKGRNERSLSRIVKANSLLRKLGEIAACLHVPHC